MPPVPPVPPPLPPPAKRPLDLPEALRSTLRSWLVSRDAAVWCLCGGTNPDDPLDKINLTDLESAVNRMNTVRLVAIEFAHLMADRRHTAEDIIRETLTELLALESPKFTLHDDGIEGSY